MEYFKLSSFLFLIIYFLLFSLSRHNTRIIQQIVTSSKPLITHFSVPIPEERERENYTVSSSSIFLRFFSFPLFHSPKKTPGIDSTTISQANHFFYILLPTKYIYLFIYFLVVNISTSSWIQSKSTQTQNLTCFKFFFYKYINGTHY